MVTSLLRGCTISLRPKPRQRSYQKTGGGRLATTDISVFLNK